MLFSRPMRNEDLIAFARRNWQAIAASKRRRWAEQKSHMTAAEALAVGDELRWHAMQLNPHLPTEEDRAKDLAVHARVSESLRRVRPPHRR